MSVSFPVTLSNEMSDEPIAAEIAQAELLDRLSQLQLMLNWELSTAILTHYIYTILQSHASSASPNVHS